MENFLNKKYKLENSENFDEYLKTIGVGLIMRSIARNITSTIQLQKNEDTSYSLNTMSSFKNVTMNFKLGEEFDEERPDGTMVKSVCTFEGNKMIHMQKADKMSKIVREFFDSGMKMTMSVDDVMCTRTYKLV